MTLIGDPVTQAFNAGVEQMLGTQPPWQNFATGAELREFLAANPLSPPLPPLDEAQERTIPGPAGDIPIRVLIPDNVRAVYLHIHGGGWVIGSHDAADQALMARAQAVGAAVVSVGYRLAPEHRYPAAQDDCEAAAKWVIDNAKAEFGTDALLIGGESAGGHLAAATTIRMRDRHSYTDFRGALLAYGVFDLRMTASQRQFGDRPLVINTPIMEWFIKHYLDGRAADDPDISPLLADLQDLPPAYFYVGTEDPLLDDTVMMAARWEAAGNETELKVYPGACHAFDGFPIPAGIEAKAAGDYFLLRCLADL